MTRNTEYRLIPVGRERSIVPTQPREAISMDIMYLPQSSKGHTHALLISDLYSMYITFFPLKGKTSSSIATALRSYFSIQGIPKIIYSDNDPSFRGDVEQLLTSYNVQHATSYPYVQRANTVESQVRKLKNAARAAIMESPVLNHSHWHILYPLVIIRLNTMLSKYGASREMVHYTDVLETHLPIITDIEYHKELEADLNYKAEKFREQIGKFLHNKRKSKESYKTGITQPHLLHELVMRKIYTPSSPLHPTYTGPFRIIELYPQGACLKNTRTGEICSAHYMNLRKITMDEFITLLPDDFDADILKNLGLYRYNRNHLPDPAKDIKLEEKDEEDDSTTASDENGAQRPKPVQQHTDANERTLRSGKVIRINLHTLPKAVSRKIKSACFTYTLSARQKCTQGKKRTCLTRSLVTPRTPYADMLQHYEEDCYFFNTTIRTPRPENYHKKPYKSSFNSPLPGFLILEMDADENKGKRVRFSTITVKFY